MLLLFSGVTRTCQDQTRVRDNFSSLLKQQLNFSSLLKQQLKFSNLE